MMEEWSCATDALPPPLASFRSASGKHSIAASVCGIAPAWESLRNQMRSRWLFRKRPAGFRSATGGGSSAILLRKHFESALARFSCKALMKKLILNNWRAKLISLLLATTLWYLIKKNVATTPSLSDEQGGQPTLIEKR